jgi:hypothetical protein
VDSSSGGSSGGGGGTRGGSGGSSGADDPTITSTDICPTDEDMLPQLLPQVSGWRVPDNSLTWEL